MLILLLTVALALCGDIQTADRKKRPCTFHDQSPSASTTVHICNLCSAAATPYLTHPSNDLLDKDTTERLFSIHLCEKTKALFYLHAPCLLFAFYEDMQDPSCPACKMKVVEMPLTSQLFFWLAEQLLHNASKKDPAWQAALTSFILSRCFNLVAEIPFNPTYLKTLNESLCKVFPLLNATVADARLFLPDSFKLLGEGVRAIGVHAIRERLPRIFEADDTEELTALNETLTTLKQLLESYTCLLYKQQIWHLQKLGYQPQCSSLPSDFQWILYEPTPVHQTEQTCFFSLKDEWHVRADAVVYKIAQEYRSSWEIYLPSVTALKTFLAQLDAMRTSHATEREA